MARKLNLTETKEETKPAMSASDFMAAVSGITAPKAPAKSKDKIPTLTPASDDIRKAVDEIVDLKQTLKETESALKTDEGLVIDFVKIEQENDSVFTKSYRVQGLNRLVTVVTADKFSSFPAEEAETLKTILGDKYNEFVETKTEMVVRSEVLSDPKLLAEFAALMPNAESIAKFFTHTTTLRATDGFDQKIFKLSKEDKEKYDALKPYVKQSKPSVRC